MPKVNGPLFSVEAHKQLAKGITYQRRPGGASVYGYKKPKVPLTFKQVRQRWLVRDAVAWWRVLSDADKALWEAKAKGRRQSGYSLFMHENTALGDEVFLYLPFYEGGGAVLHDLSQYKSHGAITGATWADGVHWKCLDFNPLIPSYVEIPADQTQLNFTAEDFSIITRVNIDDLTSFRELFGRGEVNVSGYRLMVLLTGAIRFDTYQVPIRQDTISTAGDITTGAWFTVGVSRVGASVRLYRNGVDVTSVIGVHVNPTTSPDSGIIGYYLNGAEGEMDGKIEFLRVFGGVALSEADHLAWHNALK